MKAFFIIISALSFCGLIIFNAKKTDSPSGETVKSIDAAPAEVSMSAIVPARDRSPVLVELFTSEGCSSCPPADRNLIYLNDEQPFPQASVIALSMHVDYWNRLGWIDPFSSAQFSERQGFYSNTFRLNEVYTPQMIVDGASQFVGGNLIEAQKAIDAALKTPKGDVELALAAGDKLKVKISGLPEHSLANVFLAVAEDNLSTAVRNGENGGITLNHASVVRRLKTIGQIAGGENDFETEVAYEVQPAWKKANLKLVVFVQVERNSRIIGAGQIKLSK